MNCMDAMGRKTTQMSSHDSFFKLCNTVHLLTALNILPTFISFYLSMQYDFSQNLDLIYYVNPQEIHHSQYIY